MNDTAEWQRGFDLDRLKALAAPFKARHKDLVFGAFGLTKERDIAEALAANRAIWTGDPPRAVALFHRLQRESEQRDFAQRPFAIPPNAVAVKAFAALDIEAGRKVLAALRERAMAPVWVEAFEEDEIARAALANFHYAATKISAGSEIKGVYCSMPTAVPPLSAADRATLKICEPDFLGADAHAAIVDELVAFEQLWTQHYSSYNKRKSWEAFALRGFDDDPTFIVKPHEMSKAWKDENAARLNDRPRMTDAAQHFPASLAAAACLAPAEACDRIRFMRLRSKGGELGRHADITDREAGTADGAICRFHVPIVTNPAVRFFAWTERGEKIEARPPQRCLLYLDQRKPHAVINTGDSRRVHLVVDCHATPAIRERLAA